MSYITKEAVYDLLADLEAVYPEATAALRVAVADVPEGLVRCNDCKYNNDHAECPFLIAFNYPDCEGFCSCGEPKGGAE